MSTEQRWKNCDTHFCNFYQEQEKTFPVLLKSVLQITNDCCCYHTAPPAQSSSASSSAEVHTEFPACCIVLKSTGMETSWNAKHLPCRWAASASLLHWGHQGKHPIKADWNSDPSMLQQRAGVCESSFPCHKAHGMLLHRSEQRWGTDPQLCWLQLFTCQPCQGGMLPWIQVRTGTVLADLEQPLGWAQDPNFWPRSLAWKQFPSRAALHQNLCGVRESPPSWDAKYLWWGGPCLGDGLACEWQNSLADHNP